MICKWKCNICGKQFSINGLYKVDFINTIHLREEHKKEYEQKEKLEKAVRKAEHNLFELEKNYFTELE
jgi:hypothetical protein